MSRLTPEKKHRLAYWLQQNRSATDRARLEVTKDELKDLDADALLHLAAMAFITLDGFVKVMQEEPARHENLRALSKSLGDQLEEKNTAEMRPHAELGKATREQRKVFANRKNEEERKQNGPIWDAHDEEVERLKAEGYTENKSCQIVEKTHGLGDGTVRKRRQRKLKLMQDANTE